MTQQNTCEKMKQMRLTGMLNAFRQSMNTKFSQNFTPDELIAHLIDSEWDERYNRKLKRLLKNADFRYQAAFEHIDFAQNRHLDKNLLLRLSTCQWIQKAENLLITGATGTGKSFIACAIGHQACINELSVFYFNSLKMFAKLKFAKAEGRYDKEIKKIQKQHLIILDDFGLHPIDEVSKLILLEILEDRYANKSTVIASQFPVEKWYDIIANPTIADAILDRIVHNAYQIQINGESMRKIINPVSGGKLPPEKN